MIGTTNAVGSGGGLKDTDAILQASAPAGSTVTITKGTTTKSDTGRIEADNSSTYDYYFPISQSQFDSVNPWTITATLGGQSASSQIVVNSAKSYRVGLSYWVPAEYQAVAYLESSGTQYINTGISLSEAYCHIVSDFHFVGSTSMYSWGTSSGSSLSLSVDSMTYVKLRPVNVNLTDVTKSDGWHDIEIEGSRPSSLVNWSYSIDGGTPITGSGSASLTTGVAYRLFGVDGSSIGQQRHKRFKMIDSGGTVLIDLRACYRKSDNVAGFWDDVSKTFFTNAGSGTFTVGADI